LRQQSLKDAMQAEAEAAALEAAEADAKRELRRLEQQVNRGDPLDPSQLRKLEHLTKQLEGTDAGDEPDELRDPVEEIPDTIAGMLRKLVEVNTASDLFFLAALFLVIVAVLVLVTLPFGSWVFVSGLPHRIAHFFAVGGVSAELFTLISLFLAWRAEKWQPIPALDWREFGYAPWFVHGWAILLGGIGVWQWVTAEIELRKHGHGTFGSMAIREGGYGFTRHPQYVSLGPIFCSVLLYMDRCEVTQAQAPPGRWLPHRQPSPIPGPSLACSPLANNLPVLATPWCAQPLGYDVTGGNCDVLPLCLGAD
jgi:hypothetical protein